MQEDDLDPEETVVSKSQLKRDAHALQQLGTDLLGESEDVWHRLQLPDKLISALDEARQITSRGALKRQLQYIGKLMRDLDPAPIREHFEQQRLKARHLARAHHELEDWRDRLIEEGDPAIDSFVSEHPGADRQRLRQLTRQAKKEIALNKPPKSSRALFRYIRDLTCQDPSGT